MSYTQLALILVAAAGILAVLGFRAVPARHRRAHAIAVLATASALAVLTVIFDSVMIHAELFVFDEDTLSGVSLWLAPVEDLSYGLACALALPAVWVLVGRDRD
jgi:lycopene cyclase domain-containing protein